MSIKLIIVGASGHGKVVADLAVKSGREIEGFLDDAPSGEHHFGYPVLGACQDRRGGSCEYIIAIGNNEIRRQLAGRYKNWRYTSLIHPAAVLGTGIQIGRGTVVMAGAILNADAHIGCHCIINTGAIIEHECEIGDYTHVSPGAVLAGSVKVGELCHIGAGATIRNNITICDCVTVGAGAVVVKDITEPGTYIGVPAKRYEEEIWEKNTDLNKPGCGFV